MNIWDFVKQEAINRPSKETMYCIPCQLRLTYKDLNRRVNSLCNMLVERGLKKGDRIAIISPNCHIHPEVLLTAAKGGWVCAAIDHRLTTSEIEFVLGDLEPSILFVGRNLNDIVHPLFSVFPKMEKIADLNEYENIIGTYSSEEPNIEVGEDDIVSITYTSGTTGRPKGVIYTHKNLITAWSNLAVMLDFRSNDRTLHTSPFSHVAPVWPFLLHCYYGGSNVIIDKFDPEYILEIMEREKISTWNSVPIFISRVLGVKGKEKYDLSSLRTIIYGASSIALPVLREAIKYFGNILSQIYGCSEIYLVTFLSACEHILDGPDHEVKRLESCGLPMKLYNEVRVVNADDIDVKPGEIGEVIYRGAQLSPGYWRNEEETRRCRKGEWFYTGDLATVDDDGYIYIKGRRKELIVSGGENVSPKECEDVLCRHEAVKEAAVVGIPHDQWGEAVTAFVDLKEGKSVSEGDLLRFCRERLAGYKRPKAVVFVNEFPRTTSGKIIKRQLVEAYDGKIYQ